MGQAWGTAFKNSPYPILSKPKRKKKFPFPPKNLNIYIYIFFFLKKNKNSKALSVKVNLEQGNVRFPPSSPLTVGFIGTSPAEEPAPRRGEGPKGAKGGGLPSQSAASMGVGTLPRKPHPLGIFQVGWGAGTTHSCVVFSQFQVKLRQGKQGDRRGVQKGHTGFSGALWSGGTPLPQLLDKCFNDFLFHFLQFLPHLFQKLLFHSLQV